MCSLARRAVPGGLGYRITGAGPESARKMRRGPQNGYRIGRYANPHGPYANLARVSKRVSGHDSVRLRPLLAPSEQIGTHTPRLVDDVQLVFVLALFGTVALDSKWKDRMRLSRQLP